MKFMSTPITRTRLADSSYYRFQVHPPDRRIQAVCHNFLKDVCDVAHADRIRDYYAPDIERMYLDNVRMLTATQAGRAQLAAWMVSNVPDAALRFELTEVLWNKLNDCA